jgi:hypothetical protein
MKKAGRVTGPPFFVAAFFRSFRRNQSPIHMKAILLLIMAASPDSTPVSLPSPEIVVESRVRNLLMTPKDSPGFQQLPSPEKREQCLVNKPKRGMRARSARSLQKTPA